MIPLVIETIILKRIYEIERHLKFKKCLDEIKLIDYNCNNDTASCRIISSDRSTNYFIENNNIELWIHKHISNKEFISTIFDCRLFIDIINNNCIIHSL
jgi:hypothetical protein